MSVLPLAVAATLFGTAPGARAQAVDAAVDRLTAKAVACIDGSAAAVEAAGPDLASDVNFLVGDLCAREVAAREKYKRNSAMLKMFSQSSASFTDDDGEGGALTAAQAAAAQKAADARLKAYKNARVDPETGELIGLDSSSPGFGFAVFGSASTDVVPDLRALAAGRLLAARRSRVGH